MAGAASVEDKSDDRNSKETVFILVLQYVFTYFYYVWFELRVENQKEVLLRMNEDRPWRILLLVVSSLQQEASDHAGKLPKQNKNALSLKIVMAVPNGLLDIFTLSLLSFARPRLSGLEPRIGQDQKSKTTIIISDNSRICMPLHSPLPTLNIYLCLLYVFHNHHASD